MSNVFAIFKPLNWTSNDVIQKIKKELKLKKIGHGGTLDPLADGVLIIGVNSGTKELNNHLCEQKQYKATIEFGYETETLDLEGEVKHQSHTIPDLEQIEIALNKMVNNDYWQTPPKYSAIKINGIPAYKLARNNIEVKIQQKLVKLLSFQIINYNNNQLELLIDVSKGFYVRSFARDLAYELKTYGTLTRLTRTKSGNFDLSSTYTIEGFINEYRKISNQQEQ